MEDKDWIEIDGLYFYEQPGKKDLQRCKTWEFYGTSRCPSWKHGVIRTYTKDEVKKINKERKERIASQNEKYKRRQNQRMWISLILAITAAFVSILSIVLPYILRLL